MAVPTTKQKRRLKRLTKAVDLGLALCQIDMSDGSYTGSVTGAQSNTTAVAFETYYGTAKPSLAIGAQASGTGDYTQFLRPASTLTTGDAEITIPDTASAAGVVVLEDIAATLTLKTLTDAVLNGTVTTSGLTMPAFTLGGAIDFTSYTHDHSNDANGGALSLSSALVGTNATTFEVDLDGSIPAVALGVGTTGNFTQTIKPAATLTVGDVDLTLPDTANVDDSFVFVTLAQTLASKTLTAPVINACTITGAVTITTPSVTGTWTDLGTVATVIIGGGTIDTTPIGGSTPAAGAFTTLAATTGTFSDDVSIAAGKDLTINATAGAGYLQINGATSGGIKVLPMSVGTGLTTLANQAGTYTVTLPNATCTLLGSTAANTFTAVQTIAVDDTSNTAVTEVLALKHSVSTTAGTGIGAQLAFYLDDSGDTLAEVADIEAVFTTATAGSEDCDLVFKTAFDTGTVATALTIDASANELVLGEDTSLLTAMRIYPATTSYGSFLIKAGDDTGNYVTTLSNTITAGNITVTLPATAGALATTAGTNTWSGVNTFSAEPIVSVSDAAGGQSAVTDVLSLRHVNTGTPAAGIGVGISFECTTDDAAEEQGTIDFVFTNVGTGAEDADFVFSVPTAGTMREAFRMDADAGFVVGNAAGTSEATRATIYPATASRGSFVLLAADANGGDYDTTVTPASMGQTTILTIPDPGGGTDSFVLDDTSATLTSKTLTSPEINGASSASGNFDLSGSTGTTKTTTGTFTIGGTTSLAANKNIACATGTTAVDWCLGSGVFKTTTGAVTIGPGAVGISGSVTLAADKNVTAASGTSAFDFSGASGVFKTTTGVNTFGGNVIITGAKTFTVGTGTTILGGDLEVASDIDTVAAGAALVIGGTAATSIVMGAIDIDTQIQAEDLTLSSVNPIVFQLGATPTDTLELDNAAISGFAAAGAGIAGQAAYMGTEAGGAAATAGAAGGLFNLTTGAGSAALLGAAGGAGGALAFATGAGGASVTGTPAASGAMTLDTGTGGATTTSGTAAVSGNMTLSTGDGGASASGANAGGAAGTIALNGGAGGADSDSSDVGGVGGGISLLGGDGGTGATQGDGGAVAIDAGAGDTNGAIDIGTTNSSLTTIGVADAGVVQLQSASLILDSEDPMTFQIGTVDIFQIDEAAISTFAGADNTAGHAMYAETEDGGASTTGNAGTAAGLLYLKTGDGSQGFATENEAGGAGGAFSLITGVGGAAGLDVGGTANGANGGLMTVQAGDGGLGGATSGTGGDGGGVTIDAGAKGTANTDGADGAILIGTTNADSVTIGRSGKTAEIQGVVDISDTADATIANGDFIVFMDGGATGTLAKEALADLVGVIAGTASSTGLSASNSVLSVDAGSLTGFTGAIAKDADKLLISDAGTDLSITYQALMDGVNDLTAIGAAPASADSVLVDDGGIAKKCTVANLAGAHPLKWTINFGTGAEDGDGAFTQGGGVTGGSDTTDTEAGATYCATYDKTNDEFVQLSTSSSGTDVTNNYQFFSDTKADDDAVYFGAAAKFCEIAVDMAVVQTYTGDALTWEYADSATPTWTTLAVQYDGSDATAQDGKRSFGRDGAISFIPPANWTASQPNVVLAAAGYYIRARVSTTANIAAVNATTNTVQHYVVTPNADAPTAPATGSITSIRVVNPNATVHNQNCEFLLWNVTQSLWSATTAHTWTASQMIDVFGSLSLAVTAGDKLGVIVLDDNGAGTNPQFHMELDVTPA